MANNIVLNPQMGDQFALTGVSSAYNQPSAFQPIGVTTYSTASIPSHANNGLLGKALTISGFASAGNNGTFLVVSSTATSVTTNNASGVVVVAAGLAAFQTQGFPAGYASKIENLWSNQNGENATVNANAGDCLVAIAIGLKSGDPFDLLHGSSPYAVFGGGGNTVSLAYTAGINDYNANPTISDGSSEVATISNSAETAGNVVTLTVSASNFAVGESVTLAGLTVATWLNGHTVTLIAPVNGTTLTFNDPTLHGVKVSGADTGTATEVGGNVWTLAASLNIADSDYTVSSTPPTAPNPFPSARWNTDGYYPSIYVWVAPNVQAGSYKVNLNSMYQPGITAPADYTGGAVPIFDGGVNFQVLCLSGAAAASVVESFSISTGSPADTITNPATAPAPLTVANADGDAIITIGLCKNSNAFAVGTTGALVPAPLQLISHGKLVGSEAHYAVGYALVTAAGSPYNPGFSNPLGYPMLIASLAIKSS